MTKVAVFGAGSWGTAFSVVLADAGNDVTMWGRREELCATINEKRENTDYLPGIDLPDAVGATHDPEQALDGAEVVVLAVPSQTLRQNLTEWSDVIPRDARAGLADEGRRARHAEADERGHRRGHRRRPGADRACVSGPNLAKEIAQPRAGRQRRGLRRRGGRRSGCGRCATRRRSGPTPAPT